MKKDSIRKVLNIIIVQPAGGAVVAQRLFTDNKPA